MKIYRLHDKYDTPPPAEVIQAIESGMVRIVRRVEIHESDGRRLWANAGDKSRLLNGSVTVDYNSAERRQLDLTLENVDLALRPNPGGGFWYDKIIKVFRGVEFRGSSVMPTAGVIQTSTPEAARQLARVVGLTGLEDVKIIQASQYSDVAKSSFIFVFTGTSDLSSSHTAILKEAWSRGHTIVTIGTGTTAAQVPLYPSTSAVGSFSSGLNQPGHDTFTAGAFVAKQVGGLTLPAQVASAVRDGVTKLSVWPSPDTSHVITGAFGMSPGGAGWVDIRVPELGDIELQKMLNASVRYLRGYDGEVLWEVQQGEFMVDNIVEANFPRELKVTGRDYTKKLLKYRLSRPVTFDSGTSLKRLVSAIASNAGITLDRQLLSIDTSLVLEADMSFDAGASGWDIIYPACEANGLELFFNAGGQLVARTFKDPSTTPSNWTFKTGYEDDPEGANLVTYSRSTNDSRIFNHIVVTSSPNDDSLPFYGEAIHEDPSSPTSSTRIGPRVDTVESNWLNSDAECAEFARNRLKISALESYEMDISSINFPWLEVGEIVEILDPDRLEHDPTRFLLDSLSYPLDLQPMTGTAKRVTYVGSSGN